jgi:hypothetical protein
MAVPASAACGLLVLLLSPQRLGATAQHQQAQCAGPGAAKAPLGSCAWDGAVAPAQVRAGRGSAAPRQPRATSAAALPLGAPNAVRGRLAPPPSNAPASRPMTRSATSCGS